MLSNYYLFKFSHSVVSNTLRPQGLQHARLPCPRPTTGACSCLSSRWCHPTIQSSVTPFLLLPSTFSSIRVFFQESVLASGGQSIGVSASASALPMSIQGWFPLGFTDLISLQSKELSRVFSTPQFKSINCSALNLHYGPTLTSIHDYWKNYSFD